MNYFAVQNPVRQLLQAIRLALKAIISEEAQ